jgi:hypothetical protein
LGRTNGTLYRTVLGRTNGRDYRTVLGKTIYVQGICADAVEIMFLKAVTMMILD